MKGIFQSLSQMDLGVKDFMIMANKAISNCLDKKSLITASYYIIDFASKTITFSRAGHCPTLYYDKQGQLVKFFETNGLGFGILRNDKFNEYVDVYNLKYSSGDIIFLYTDGITEAKNKDGAEFGYERIAKHLEKYASKPLEEIKDRLVNKIYDFCGSQTPEDDFTLVLIKFI